MEPTTARVVALSLLAQSIVHIRSAAGASSPLADSHIVVLLWLDNDAGLEAARVAASRAQDPRTRRFALSAASQREDAGLALDSLRQASGATAMDFDEFARRTRRDIGRLAAVPAAAFDAVFLRDQERAGRALVEDLDAFGLPNASDPRVLAAARRARQLAAQLSEEAGRLLAELSAH